MQKRTRLQAFVFRAKIFAAVAAGLIVAVAVLVAVFSPDTPTCDRAAASKREAWIGTASPEYGGFAPTQRGFRVSGKCSDAIGDRMLSCSIDAVRGVHGDSPYLQRARDLGFLTYVCEGGDTRVEFPISHVLAP